MSSEAIQNLLQQSTDNSATWIAATAAVLLALIAAGTAQWRLYIQLRHDRELKDLDELRALLDKCSEAGSIAVRKHQEYINRARITPQAAIPEYRAAAGISETPPLRETKATLDEASDRLMEALEPIGMLYQRLVLRLGEQHTLSQAFLVVQGTLTSAILVPSLVANTAAESEKRQSELDDQLDRSRDAYFGWLEEGRRLVGVRLRGES